MWGIRIGNRRERGRDMVFLYLRKMPSADRLQHPLRGGVVLHLFRTFS